MGISHSSPTDTCAYLQLREEHKETIRSVTKLAEWYRKFNELVRCMLQFTANK
jgi:hypothetical protein